MDSRYTNDHTRDYSDEHDLDDRHSVAGDDREISLGTSTILGIFFALALVCAVFFGFGYTMGRKSAQSTPAATEPSAAAATGSTAGSTAGNMSKPSSGSLAPSRAGTPALNSAEDSSPDSDTAAASTCSTPVKQPAPTGQTPAAVSATPQTRPAGQAAPVTRPPAPMSSATSPAQPGGASFAVQVAAVSHKEDADVLLAALRKRGYTVVVRGEPQDKLLHVQLGPFATKKDAEAMRQRLLADGYNAIVK